MLIILVSLTFPPGPSSYSSSLSYSPRKLKMGWPRRRSAQDLIWISTLTTSWHTRGRWMVQIMVPRPVCLPHVTPQRFPTLIMHPNGTYDWSYGLHHLIWTTCCPLFTPSDAFFFSVCHDIRPPSVPLGASPTFTPAVPVHSSDTHLPTHRASKCTCSAHLSRHIPGMVEDIGFC